MARNGDRSEAAFQLILYLLIVCALAIGGLAHFTAVFVGLVQILVTAAVVAGLLFFAFIVWKARHQAQIETAPSRPSAASAIPVLSATALRQIDWYQFEKVVGRLLTIEGHEVVQLGGAKPDGGVDLIARKHSSKILVQCKHWQNWRVNNATVREMVGALKINGGDRLSVYTLNPETGAAGRLAGEHGIEIVSEEEILERMWAAGATRFADLLDPNQKRCPACDSRLILRQGDFPSFWGCSRYPDCTGKIRLRRESSINR